MDFLLFGLGENEVPISLGANLKLILMCNECIMNVDKCE